MAYYLTVETTKGNFIPLNIVNSKYFTRLSNLKKSGATLKEIDTFTTMFNNELELRQKLIDEDILNVLDANKKLSIRQLKNGKYQKVMYDFMYQKDIEYIIEPKNIIRKINNKLYNKDFRFIEKYANNFINYYECLSTAPEVRQFAKESIRLGIISSHFYELDENNDDALVRMTKLLIYKHYQLENGKTIYKNEIEYRNLHSIIAFVNHYDKGYKEEINEDKTPSSNKILRKILNKKNKQIEGQYSLFE